VSIHGKELGNIPRGAYLSPFSSIGWNWPPPFVDDFNLEMDLVLDKKAFIYALMHSPHLSSDSLLNMVYELVWHCFVLNDFANGFDFCFEICMHITCGHVPPSVSHMFVTTWLLVLGKQVGGVRLIMIGKVIYRLVAYTLVI